MNKAADPPPPHPTPVKGQKRNGKWGEGSPSGHAWPRKGTDAILLGTS